MTTLNLDHLTLDNGSHSRRTEGVCLMEAVAWYAGENHSDMPACVSLVLRRYGITLNDRLPAERRQELKQFIPRLVGTAGDGLDEQRRQLASQALMVEWLPQWLRLAKLDDLAAQAEAGAALTGLELTRALRAIRDLTWKARQAKRDELKGKIEAELRKRWADKPAAADAVAVAVAAAAADAVAAADGPIVKKYSDEWYALRRKVYDSTYAAMRKHYETSDTFAAVRALRDTQLDQAIDLYSRMIQPTAVTARPLPRTPAGQVGKTLPGRPQRPSPRPSHPCRANSPPLARTRRRR